MSNLYPLAMKQEWKLQNYSIYDHHTEVEAGRSYSTYVLKLKHLSKARRDQKNFFLLSNKQRLVTAKEAELGKKIILISKGWLVFKNKRVRNISIKKNEVKSKSNSIKNMGYQILKINFKALLNAHNKNYKLLSTSIQPSLSKLLKKKLPALP